MTGCLDKVIEMFGGVFDYDTIRRAARSCDPNAFKQAEEDGSDAVLSLLQKLKPSICSMLGITCTSDNQPDISDALYLEASSVLAEADYEKYPMFQGLDMDNLTTMIQEGADRNEMSCQDYIASLFPEQEVAAKLEEMYDRAGPMSPLIASLFYGSAGVPFRLAVMTAYRVFEDMDVVAISDDTLSKYQNVLDRWMAADVPGDVADAAMRECYLRAVLEMNFDAGAVDTYIQKRVVDSANPVRSLDVLIREFPLVVRTLCGVTTMNDDLRVIDELTLY